jgi:hypothetical protein
MKLNINKLQCMNYYIAFNKDTEEDYGSWYGLDGIRSLYRNCKAYNENFKDALKSLNEHGQFVGSKINITMV